MKKVSKNLSSLITFENLFGLILAFLIIFEFKVEDNIKQVINSPLGIVFSLIAVIIIFLFMNPLIGLLFLIYLYETVKSPYNNVVNYKQNNENNKINILKKLNSSLPYNNNSDSPDSVEKKVINDMAPIIKKNENPNAKFIPNIQTNLKYDMI